MNVRNVSKEGLNLNIYQIIKNQIFRRKLNFVEIIKFELWR